MVSLARAFSLRYIPLTDLISEGNLGLIQSIETTDLTAGHRLLSYASWRIRGNILDFARRFRAFSAGPPARDVSWTVYQKTFEHLQQTLQREPVEDELCEALPAYPIDVRRCQMGSKAAVLLIIPTQGQPLPYPVLSVTTFRIIANKWLLRIRERTRFWMKDITEG